MNELSNILTDATRAIAECYFHLPIAGGDSVYRERVYCYELYHQMRCRWPVDTAFCLNGELDKSAHPLLSKLGIDQKPDLLIHQPGTMDGNNAIIEVKTSRAQGDGVRKDIETLSLFVNNAGYRRAIYLIYGREAEATVGLVKQVGTTVKSIARIEVWMHCEAGKPATLALNL